MKWQPHTGSFVLIDDVGWKRAIIFKDELWRTVAPLGYPGLARERSARTKREIVKLAERLVREAERGES